MKHSSSQFRTIFLGTPAFAVPCLEKLLEDEHFKVVGVISQPDRPAGRNMKIQESPVKQLALKAGLPVLTPEKVLHIQEAILEWQAETAVVVAFGQILPKSFLDLFSGKVVNVHASLLPRWRGAAPIQRSLMAGDTETGVSLQVVVPKLDAGDVLGVRKVSLQPSTRASDLYMELKNLGPELLALEYADFLRGQLAGQMQDESQVTIASKIKKEEGLVDWSLSAEKIHNYFRGLFIWPGTWTLRQKKNLKIKNCRLSQSVVKNRSPGEVASVGDSSIVVACGSGALEILEVQPESKGVMKISEYLKGYPVKVGEKLGS